MRLTKISNISSAHCYRVQLPVVFSNTRNIVMFKPNAFFIKSIRLRRTKKKDDDGDGAGGRDAGREGGMRFCQNSDHGHLLLA